MVSAELSAALARFDERIMEPHQFGENDCCIACADVLQPAWGVDLMVLYGRDYSTAAGYFRLIRKRGCSTLREAVALAAENADAVAVDAPYRDFDLGIVFCGTPNGVMELPGFWLDGAFRARSPFGAVYQMEAEKAWRHG